MPGSWKIVITLTHTGLGYCTPYNGQLVSIPQTQKAICKYSVVTFHLIATIACIERFPSLCNLCVISFISKEIFTCKIFHVERLNFHHNGP